MNKIEELEVTIKEVLVQIEELKNPKPTQIGRAKSGEIYYAIHYANNSITKIKEARDNYDNIMCLTGNYYLTEALAQKELNRQTAYTTITKAYIEHGDDTVCDWHDNNQPKYYFFVNSFTLQKEYCYLIRHQPKALHTTSSKARDWVFDNLQDELNCWYEIE